MRHKSSIGRLFRPFAYWLATTSLTLTMPLLAVAQPAPPGASASGDDVAGQPDTDPPPIAGSLAAIAGSVSFHTAGDTQWSPATLNYPVTNGEGFWTEPQASATIDIADDSVVLDESTEFDVATLDQSQFVATEAQGAIFVHLNSLNHGQSLVVNTPRGAVQISQAGEYEIVAGDTNDATTITVVQGAAHISGTNLALDVGPNQTATITGSDTLLGAVGAFQEDAFLKAQLQLVPPPPRQSVPQECQTMTGGRQLGSYGNFTQTAQYGQVWYPSNVPSGWAPYRDGHWAYVAPWGWTWVDNARWGFAPFHYGRWAQINGRWGWLPDGGAPYVAGSYPIYSPALVAFVGVGGAGLGFSVGVGGYAPAWVPLGPHEPYYPWYHFHEGYFARINSFYGVPRTIINRGPTYYNTVNIHENNYFINRGAATVIPQAAFARGQSAMSVGRPLPERAFADARPLAGRLPVRPTAFTPNLPPEAARHFNIALPPRPSHVAAGPRIVPATQGAHTVPELRRAALPQNVHGEPAQVRPGHVEAQRPGQPALRPSEATRPGVTALRPGEVARPVAPSVRPGENTRPGEPPLRPGVAAHPNELAAHPGEPARTGAKPADHLPGTLRPSEMPALRTPAARPPDFKHPLKPGAAASADSARRDAQPHPADRSEIAPHSTSRLDAPKADVRAPTHAEGHAPAHEAARNTIKPETAKPETNATERPDAARREPPKPLDRAEPHVAPRAEARSENHAAPRPQTRPAEHTDAPSPEPRHAEPAHAAAKPADHPANKKEETHR
jgi:hypothetical protein